jgi:hypothetical protein
MKMHALHNSKQTVTSKKLPLQLGVTDYKGATSMMLSTW